MKLKLEVKFEIKKTTLTWLGLRLSLRLFPSISLYPLIYLREARAAKQVLTSVNEINEKKLICTTAIIYTPIIFPEINPIKKVQGMQQI